MGALDREIYSQDKRLKSSGWVLNVATQVQNPLGGRLFRQERLIETGKTRSAPPSINVLFMEFDLKNLLQALLAVHLGSGFDRDCTKGPHPLPRGARQR